MVQFRGARRMAAELSALRLLPTVMIQIDAGAPRAALKSGCRQRQVGRVLAPAALVTLIAGCGAGSGEGLDFAGRPRRRRGHSARGHARIHPGKHLRPVLHHLPCRRGGPARPAARCLEQLHEPGRRGEPRGTTRTSGSSPVILATATSCTSSRAGPRSASACRSAEGRCLTRSSPLCASGLPTARCRTRRAARRPRR